MDGYASDTGMAPSINTSGIGDYLTAHTVILAHANIYRMYEREFRKQQQGRLSVFCDKELILYLVSKEMYVNFNPTISGSNYPRGKIPVSSG
jgi:hypothetical protein